MHPAYDHKAGRNAEVTKASILPRRLAKLSACTELAAIAADVPPDAPVGGTYSTEEPFAGRIELSVRAGEHRFVRVRNVSPDATKEEKEAARRELIDELFEELIKLASSNITKRKFDEPWKPLPLSQRIIGFFEMQFVAFAVLLGWTPKGKRGAK